jgi:SWI/SNF-related matrix-associated actin-dependent regulator 1 of chromatin subfamily A
MELYPFQKNDVVKLGKQKAALIGSEMGTGKTHCAIALDMHWYEKEKNKGVKVEPTLIVAPLNTHDSWQEKYAVQNPEADVYTIDRKNREGFLRALKAGTHDVYLMHWDALRLMPELTDYKFNVIVGDEIHHIANRKAQQTRAFKRLKCNYKLGLSGTASGDQPANLWSILNWLWPSYYTSYWKFFDYYVVTELQPAGYKKVVGVKNTHILKKEMSPWYVRHLKRDRCCEDHPNGVMHWLPEKTYDTVWVNLSPTQRRAYNQMREHMVAWVGEHEETPLTATVAVAQMARLSQMALATPEITVKMVQAKWAKKDPLTGRFELRWNKDGSPMMVPQETVTLHLPSTKIDRLKEIIEDHPEKQFVVFSSSKKACYLAHQALAQAKIGSEVLSGDTPQGQRQDLVGRFRRNEYQVFIGVIAAAAEGIDGLQEATDTLIFLDRDWSSTKNKQAEDRLHRGGQKDTVQIIDIMARDTVDMGRHQKLEDKWSWIRKILGDDFNNRVYGK